MSKFFILTQNILAFIQKQEILNFPKKLKMLEHSNSGDEADNFSKFQKENPKGNVI